MKQRPNILFLMTDQMQSRVLNPDSPCLTPNLDKLAANGIRFQNAYTPNAVCSPARASLMTGLLPHNHGVLCVTHVVDDDQCCLRTEAPHWAQCLKKAGYKTGYFGKWHVERTEQLDEFGWDVFAEHHGERFKQTYERIKTIDSENVKTSLHKDNINPGYKTSPLYSVNNIPAAERSMGVTTQMALDYLDEVATQNEPWCCFVSIVEPHDPFRTSEEAFNQYDVDSMPLAPNVHDDLQNRPGIYRKAAKIWQDMTDRERREAMACYYASITELDEQYGRLLTWLEEHGQLDNTLIVFTSDHGELLGAHGLYCKNISASEEVYQIPLIISGPGVAKGELCDAKVGLHDLCQTLLDQTGLQPFDVPDSKSFSQCLVNPQDTSDFQSGFAEYFGGRIWMTQRVTWDGSWKYVFNGFDEDELYNLVKDPYELNNLAADPKHEKQLERMCALMWNYVEKTGDQSLLNTHYPILRLAPYGPGIQEKYNG